MGIFYGFIIFAAILAVVFILEGAFVEKDSSAQGCAIGLAVVAGIVLLALFGMFSVKNPGAAGGIAIFLIAIIVLIFTVRAVSKNAAAKREQMYKFYCACKKKKLWNVDSKTTFQKMLILGKEFGLYTKADIEEAIQIGKSIDADKKIESDSAKQESLEKELKNNQSADKAKYNKELTNAVIKGKDKYWTALKTELKDVNERLKTLKTITYDDFFKKHKSDDWGWAGGIADAIAGPGAGMMAAMEAHEKNVQYNNAVDAHNMNMLQMGITPSYVDKWKAETESKLLSRRSAITQTLDEITGLLFDDSNQEEILENLKFTITPTYIKKSHFLSLKVTVEVPKPVYIFDTEAIVDGSVAIDVIDEDGDVAGHAYFCASGFDKTNINTVGFSHTKPRSVIAIPTENDGYEETQKYTFKIRPYSLWLIEKPS